MYVKKKRCSYLGKSYKSFPFLDKERKTHLFFLSSEYQKKKQNNKKFISKSKSLNLLLFSHSHSFPHSLLCHPFFNRLTYPFFSLFLLINIPLFFCFLTYFLIYKTNNAQRNF